jgi:cytochrome P450
VTTRQDRQDISMREISQRANLDDPYPLYRRVREVSPVLWDASMGTSGAWMVTGYDAAETVLRDRRFSARRPHWEQPNTSQAATADMLHALANSLFVSDPPEHTRIRTQLAGPFLPHAAWRLRGWIESTAADLLDAALARGRLELMNDFALKLPSTLVATIVGIPQADLENVWRMILHWGIVVDDGPVSLLDPDHDTARVGEFLDYVRGLLADRSNRRPEDLLQVAADRAAQGGFACEDEILANIAFVLAAGQTTTAHQIGNSVLALLAYPDTYRRLVDDPGLVAAAVPEFLRYDPPVQLVKRRALEAVELGDRRVEPGQELYVWIGAANRDPARFPDPDRLDIDRGDVAHLAFGYGPHYCLGSRLGQLAAETALRQFVERVPSPSVDLSQVTRMGVPTFRGPYQLPLSFDRSPALAKGPN